MVNIKEFAREKGNNRIVIVFKEMDERIISIFKREHNLNIGVYSMDNKQFGMVLEKEYLPFYFIVNKNSTVQNTFIPYKGVDNYSDQYFQLVIENILKVKKLHQ
jgi:hypothetical protein